MVIILFLQVLFTNTENVQLIKTAKMKKLKL